MEGLRDYLCSQHKDGPWVAIFASSYEQAATQFARNEELMVGDSIFVGIPSPVPNLFTEEHLTQFIVDRLGIQNCHELRAMTQGLAGEANYRVQKFAADKAAIVGKVMQVREIVVTESMAIPRHVLAS